MYCIKQKCEEYYGLNVFQAVKEYRAWVTQISNFSRTTVEVYCECYLLLRPVLRSDVDSTVVALLLTININIIVITAEIEIINSLHDVLLLLVLMLNS